MIQRMENWKKVIGFEDFYMVSSKGRIKRIAKGGAAQIGKILVKSADPDGYHRIGLTVDSVRVTKKVHRLVAENFLGKIPDGYTVNHKDGDKQNNCMENLEIVSRGANIAHAFQVIKTQNVTGHLNPRAILTDEKVIEIRERLSNGCRPSILVAEYGVTKYTISNIKMRKTWMHI